MTIARIFSPRIYEIFRMFSLSISLSLSLSLSARFVRVLRYTIALVGRRWAPLKREFGIGRVLFYGV